MRQVSFEEAAAVGGGACEDLTFTVGLTNISISGSLGDWANCVDTLGNRIADSFNSVSASLATGIPYGEAHVG